MVQAIGHAVQIGEPGGDAVEDALAVEIIFDGANGAVHQVLGPEHIALGPGFADFQDVPLHLIQQRVHLALVIINPADDVGAGGDHFAQQKLFADNFEVITQIRRAGHGVLQLAEIAQPADLLQQLLVFQPLLHGDQIHRFARVEHVHELLVDGLVTQVVEGFAALVLEFFDAFADAFVGGKQCAAQHALLRLGRMRRQAVQFQGVRPGVFPAPGLLQIGRRAGAF